jgi:flavin-dependent dehydrogenase
MDDFLKSMGQKGETTKMTASSMDDFLKSLGDGANVTPEARKAAQAVDAAASMAAYLQSLEDESSTASRFKKTANEYADYLKKQARLTMTGGVAVSQQVPGERPIPDLDTLGMTKRIMERVQTGEQATGAGGATTWEAFEKAEANWARLKEYIARPNDPIPRPFVIENSKDGNPRCYAKLEQQKEYRLDYDIAVCGGTLGIFFATALQLRGHRVCVIEAGPFRGREQEWNISMDELMHLVKLGVLSQQDIDAAIKTEFPGCRSGFKHKEVDVEEGYLENGIGYECFTEGVLNLGISPAILLDRVAERFKYLGGVIEESSPLKGVVVSTPFGAVLDLGSEREPITAEIVIDSMGNNSPITRQQRFGSTPDGVCVVVGTCAAGYDPKTNLNGDIIYTNTPIQDKRRNGKQQYFWEAFPVGIGRDGKEPGTSDVKTTYMFTYIDADQRRPKLETLMQDYWRLLPQYQPSISNPELDLDVKRVLFAYFPTYKDSPLPSGFDRILAVGDASGIQSPLSFGGFGSLTRHLERVTDAVTEALDSGLLYKEDLSEINTYTPNLSAAWMFQKAMSVRMGQPFVDPRFINRLLATNFEVMEKMGPRTIKPFLQDVVRFDALVGSLARSFAADPTFTPQILAWVGLPTLVEWVGHVGMMGTYSALDTLVSPWLRPVTDAALRTGRRRYQLHRQMDAWRYGSGNDYDVEAIPED